MRNTFFALSAALLLTGCAGDKLVPSNDAVTLTAATNVTPATVGATNAARPDYLLCANDTIHVKVYQEDDLDAKVRISKDGTIVLALLDSVSVGGKTREQAALHIRNLLAKKYLVNPQVSVDIMEYSKRRFTVLGQVARPGTYEMPGDESVSLLQAISMAGGYTRIGSGKGVTVQRGQGAQKQVFTLNADSMAKNKDAKNFEILADDVITVREKYL